jgi:putative MFS transporter
MIVLGFWFIFYIPMYGFSSYLPLILQGLGLSLSGAIFVTVLARIAPLVSSFLAVLLVERVERRTLIIVSALAFAVAMVFLALPLGQVLASVAVLLATFALSFFGPPAYTYTSEIFPTSARATASAVGDGVGHLGGAIAPFIMLPLLAAAGAAPAVLLMGVFAVAAAVVLRFGPRTRGRSLEELSREPIAETATTEIGYRQISAGDGERPGAQ